jgi:hypothetical protein
MSVTDCAECARLWRLYAEATNRHMMLIAEQAEAAKLGEVDKFRHLEDDKTEAAIERGRARGAVEKHEAEVHGKKSAGQ